MPAARLERQELERRASAKLARPEFSGRVEAWLDAMILDGASWRDAAQANRIKLKTARLLLGNPRIARAMSERAGRVRVGESVRNVAAAVRIRDRAFDADPTAATMKASIEAMKFLEAPLGGSGNGVTLNLGVQVGGIVGYVMDLREDIDEPIVIDATPVQDGR